VRRSLFAGALLVGACTGGGDRGGAAPVDAGKEPPGLPANCPAQPVTNTASSTERDELFGFLTGTGWANSTGNLQLHRDGRYQRQTRESDAIGPVLAGAWTLVAYDARSGAVFLDDRSLLPVERQDDGRLAFGFAFFSPQGTLPATQEEAKRTAGELALPRLPALLAPLVDVCWHKANSLELQREPEVIALRKDGRFRAAFRSSSCLQEGTFLFSADPNDAEHPRLWLLGTSSCALDQSEPPGWRSEPALVGDLLVLGGTLKEIPVQHQARTFRATGRAPGPSTFIDRGFELTVTGTYDEEPVVGRPWQLRLSLESPLTKIQLGGLAIEVQVLQATDGRLVPVGAPAMLLDRSLDVPLDRGEKHDENVALAFPTAGPLVRLRLRVTASDAQSKAPLLDSTDYAFVIAVAPPAGN
jgi:hypothetical protein